MIQLKFIDAFKGMEKLENNSIDLFLVDPPYFLNYKHWDGKRNEFAIFFAQFIQLMVKKMKPNGTAWFFMAKDHLFANKDKKVQFGLINMLEEYGSVHLDNWVTWGRQKGRGSKNKLKSTREEIIHFTKDKKDYTWNSVQVLREVICPYVKDGRPRGWFVNADGERVRWTGLGNVWFYSSPQWNGLLDKQRHSAQKPFMIYERLILLSSNEGDLVVDPFAGSAVSLIVSKYHNRNYIGFENDKEIFSESKQFIKENYKKIIEEFEKNKLNPVELKDESDMS